MYVAGKALKRRELHSLRESAVIDITILVIECTLSQQASLSFLPLLPSQFNNEISFIHKNNKVTPPPSCAALMQSPDLTTKKSIKNLYKRGS